MKIHDLTWGWDEHSLLVAKGHVDPDEFFAECQRQCGLRGSADASKIEHVHMRITPDSTGRFDSLWNIVEPGRGAFKATILECH